MSDTLYWHFAQVDDNGTPHLGYDDNREIKPGETLRVEGAPILCKHGLHASAKLWDALGYASVRRLALCRVTLGGTVLHDTDKSAANERTVVAMLDADATDQLLRDWGRWCALQVIHLWDAPDIVRQYLETGDESLRAAAWDGARAAARAAARNAAGAAAWAAAGAAAVAVAGAAAEAGALAGALAAAGAAAVAAAEAEAVAAAEAEAAARDAAWDGARDAAIERYAAELERRALVVMGLDEHAQKGSQA